MRRSERTTPHAVASLAWQVRAAQFCHWCHERDLAMGWGVQCAACAAHGTPTAPRVPAPPRTRLGSQLGWVWR
jgi:hypothetical protein